MTNIRIIRLGLGTTLTVFFIWLIFRKINFQDLGSTFLDSKKSWLFAALIAFFFGYICRIERWRLMLSNYNPDLKWGQCAGPLLASFATNNVLPFRVGDVLRAFAFCDRLRVGSSTIIATLIVERLLDFLMVCLLLSVAIAAFGFDINALVGAGNFALASTVTGILIALFFPQTFLGILNVCGNRLSRLFPNFGIRLADEISTIFFTLIHLSKGNLMIRLVTWSIGVWLAEGFVFLFVAYALASIVVPTAGWFALPVGTLSTLIPSTPGYVGTFDYFTALAMTTLGNSNTSSTAYALLVHALLWLPPTLIGGIYLILYPSDKKLTS